MREIISIIRNLPKHIATAVFNLFRNGSMTVYSIIAVTVTLAMMGIIGVIAVNIQNMTMNIENSLSIYVKLEKDINDEQAALVGTQILGIEGITNCTYSSKEDELNKLIEYYGEDGESFFADYHGDQNPCGASYTVEIDHADRLEEVTALINTIENVNKANYGGASTSTLVKMLEKIRDYGAIFVAGLVVVVILLISSTIHMTIENRDSEVQIMRMVGASNWYIRIPFMIEGALIGLIGSIVPIAAIFFGYKKIYAGLSGQLMADMLMLVKPATVNQLFWMLAAIGAVVGFIGAAFATGKHLKK